MSNFALCKILKLPDLNRNNNCQAESLTIQFFACTLLFQCEKNLPIVELGILEC